MTLYGISKLQHLLSNNISNNCEVLEVGCVELRKNKINQFKSFIPSFILTQLLVWIINGFYLIGHLFWINVLVKFFFKCD